jgi:threonine dehydrogenase-like Zn-dependent dehydrogenase
MQPSKAKKGTSMKAFVMKAIGQVGFLEKPIPRPGPNDAIVKTTRALICTSDSHTVGGAIGPRENLTLGHEAVGIVHEVGSNVTRFKPGDRVLVGAITPDWGDPASQAGHSSQSGGPLGGWKFSNTKDGVFADFSKEDVVQRTLDLTEGQGVDTAIEALGADVTFQNAIKVTKAGGTISNVGYHGHGDVVHIPIIEWGVGMAEKTITTGLCPGGRLRMERLLRVLEMKRVDPTLMTTHTFPFDEMEKTFEIMDKKLDGVLKPLIVF